LTGPRDETDRLTPRLISAAVLGFLLFAPPLLSLFDHKARVFGVPILVAYLFIAWGLIIGLVAAIISADAGRTRE
jgi:hypothetical protein